MGMERTGSAGQRDARPVRAGRFRKGLAGLLALALLALSVVPASAARTLGEAGRPGEHHAAAAAASAGCGSHDHGAVPAPSDRGPPRGHHHDDGERLPSALACCVALHCPMLLADLGSAPAGPSPPAGLRVRAAAAERRPAGLDIRPALPPPRPAAV